MLRLIAVWGEFHLITYNFESFSFNTFNIRSIRRIEIIEDANKYGFQKFTFCKKRKV